MQSSLCSKTWWVLQAYYGVTIHVNVPEVHLAPFLVNVPIWVCQMWEPACESSESSQPALIYLRKSEWQKHVKPYILNAECKHGCEIFFLWCETRYSNSFKSKHDSKRYNKFIACDVLFLKHCIKHRGRRALFVKRFLPNISWNMDNV